MVPFNTQVSTRSLALQTVNSATSNSIRREKSTFEQSRYPPCIGYCGGGIPIAADNTGRRHGVNAVVDKDLTSAHLANLLGAEELLILTAVSCVSINYGQPQQQELDVVSVAELRAYFAEGHFPIGSMGPKVQAAIRFVEGGGRRAIIAHLDEASAALRGEAGTHVHSSA